MAVTLLIIATLTFLAYNAMHRARPRATLESTSAELQSLVHQARQKALAQATRVALLVAPSYNNGQGTGRLVLVQDEPDGSANPSLFSPAGTPSFGTYDFSNPTATAGGQVLDTLDLPLGVLVGPAGGSGLDPLPFPYDNITTNAPCSFCAAGGYGAIVFDSRGRATFYSADGGGAIQSSGQAGGASITLYGPDVLSGPGGQYTTHTLVITSPQGMLRTFHNG